MPSAPHSEMAVVRRLAERKMAIGSDPVQAQTLAAWRSLNDLQPVRPMVWINELPWHEIEENLPDARLVCTDPFLRNLERQLRWELVQWEYFRCDMVVDPVVYVTKVGDPASSYADYGIVEQAVKAEDALDVSYLPVINSLEDADQIRTPKVCFDHQATDRIFSRTAELLDGIIPVQLRGIVHQWHSPWDQIIHWYGIERLYTDMLDRPELVHRVMANFMRALNAVVDEQTRLGLLDVGNGNWRVGSGGMGACSTLPESVAGRTVTPKDQWGCSCAQIFSEVSPDMHEEFSLQYERPLLERFGLTYYGCCEPLHRKISILSTIPNLRKISISPRADLAAAANAAAGRYALSWKPNPADLAWDNFDADACAETARQALAQAGGAPLEIILKDVTTIRDQPERLGQWADAIMAVVNP